MWPKRNISDIEMTSTPAAILGTTKKWTMPIHHWKQALNHFAILCEKRIPELTNS